MKFRLSDQISIFGIIFRVQNVLSSDPGSSELAPSKSTIERLEKVDQSLDTKISLKLKDNVRTLNALNDAKKIYLKANNHTESDSLLSCLYKNILSRFESYKLNKTLKDMIKANLEEIIGLYPTSNETLDEGKIKIDMERVTEDFVYLNIFLEIAHRIKPENIQVYNKMNEELELLFRTYKLLIYMNKTNTDTTESVPSIEMENCKDLTNTCMSIVIYFLNAQKLIAEKDEAKSGQIVKDFIENADCNEEIQKAIDDFLTAKVHSSLSEFMTSYCRSMFISSYSVFSEETQRKANNWFLRFWHFHMEVAATGEKEPNFATYLKTITANRLIIFAKEIIGKEGVENIDLVYQKLSNIFEINKAFTTKTTELIDWASVHASGKDEILSILFYTGMLLVVINLGLAAYISIKSG